MTVRMFVLVWIIGASWLSKSQGHYRSSDYDDDEISLVEESG